MRKAIFLSGLMIFIVLGVSACAANTSSPTASSVPETPTGTSLPSTPARQILPTSTLFHPPESKLTEPVRKACVQAIEKYLQANPCENWEEYHNLIHPESQIFQTTPMASNDPACVLTAPKTILTIVPAAERTQGYTSGYSSPTLPHEYVFFVEYNIEWQPGVIPVVENPVMMLFHMIYDTDTRACLFYSAGW